MAYLFTFVVLVAGFLATTFIKNAELFFSDKTFLGLQPEFLVNVQSETIGLLIETIIIATFLPWIIARRQRQIVEKTKHFVALQIRDSLSALLLDIDGLGRAEHLRRIDSLIRQASLSIDVEGRAASLSLMNALDAYAVNPAARHTHHRLRSAFAELLDAYSIGQRTKIIALDRISLGLRYQKEVASAA